MATTTFTPVPCSDADRRAIYAEAKMGEAIERRLADVLYLCAISPTLARVVADHVAGAPAPTPDSMMKEVYTPALPSILDGLAKAAAEGLVSDFECAVQGWGTRSVDETRSALLEVLTR